MNSPDDLYFLASDRGAALLEELADADFERDLIRGVTALRGRGLDAHQANLLITQVKLRQKAAAKFGADAAKMFFTEDALQQASDPRIRAYRAGMIRDANVLDLCCGIGADSLALAALNQSVTGVDLDTARIAIAGYNAGALGLSKAQFIVADAQALDHPAVDVVFFDPARRDSDGRRIYDVRRYIPPLDTIDRYDAARKLVKLSPGVDLDQLRDFPARVEFISVDGDLKEALLHVGESGLTATHISADGARHHWHNDGDEPELTLAAPRRWLIEPDSAVIRAGLVRHLAALMNGALLDETIAYITADHAIVDHAPESVWLRAWRVLDWMPFHLKRLRAYLRERNVGAVTVKKRGSAITPEDLTAKLKLKGDESRTLVLTRHAGEPIVIICADYGKD